MDKTAKTELHRVFLVERLPEPLILASSHLQIFDNYIENTRMRLRLIRVPETREWTRILQQRFPVNDTDLTCWKVAEIYLNENEYHALERFEGREIRKNRYFHEFDGRSFKFDIFLGELWGLCMAKVEFQHTEEMEKFESPPFVVFEVTGDPFFFGENLVGKKFANVQAEVSKVGAAVPLVSEMPDE